MSELGVLLDKHGRPERRVSAEQLLKAYGARPKVPDHVQKWLDLAEVDGWQGPKASGIGWRDVITKRRTMTSDGAQILNTTTETIMTPDYTFAADDMEVGDTFKYTLFFNWSSVITTPGTLTLRLRWGGVGGTSLAASGAYAPDPTAASTTITACVEWYLICRATGSSGSIFAFGTIEWGGDYDDASATTLKGNLDMRMAPTSAPAAVTVDTTTSKALSPTAQFSVSTATTQLQAHLAILESLN